MTWLYGLGVKKMVSFLGTDCAWLWASSQATTFRRSIFFIVHVNLEAQATVCVVRDIMEGQCVVLFPKYFTKIRFLMGNNIFLMICIRRNA